MAADLGNPARRLRLLLLLVALIVAAAAAARGLLAGDPIAARAGDDMRAARDALLAEGRYDEDGYVRMPDPSRGDWLWARPELGQTFDQYVAARTPRRPQAATRPAIVLAPLGALGPRAAGALETLRAYLGIFFGREAALATAAALPAGAYVEKRRQYDAGRILDALAARRPRRALVYAAVADEDLFAEGLAFVFGLGSLKHDVGVYSLLRFRRDEPTDTQFLRRSMKLLNHEVGHVLGIDHCIYYRCSMNGTNSLRETDAAPIHYCPVCLHKLAWFLDLDLRERWAKLAAFYEGHGLADEARWIEARLERLRETGKSVLWRDPPR